MKLALIIDCKPGEHSDEAIRRTLQEMLDDPFPMRIPLPGDGRFEVRFGGQINTSTIVFDTFGMADHAEYVEIERVDQARG